MTDKLIYIYDVVIQKKEWDRLDADNAQEFIHLHFKDIAKKFVYQLEQGENGTYHYQCFINLKQKQRLGTLAKDLNDRLETSIGRIASVRICSDNGKTQLKSYCIKTDNTYVAGPWGDKPIPKPYLGEDLGDIRFTRKPWQARLENILLGEPDDRTIYWIYNQSGNVGKSKFVKWGAWKHNWNFCTIANTSGIGQFVCQVADKRVFLFDLPRTKSKSLFMEDLINGAEAVKNGMVFNTRYETGHALFACPHVVFFANVLPCREWFSRDRFVVWDVYHIDAEPRVFQYHDLPSITDEEPEPKRHKSKK